jgi:hypothetical protein
MRSTHPTKILARTGQCLAAAALVLAGAGVAVGPGAGVAYAGQGCVLRGGTVLTDGSIFTTPNGTTITCDLGMICRYRKNLDQGCEYRPAAMAPEDSPPPKPGLEPLPQAPDVGVGPGAPVGPVPVDPNTGQGYLSSRTVSAAALG